MADLDVTQDANLTSITAPATNDRLMLIRNSDSVLGDMTLSVLYSVINTLPQGMLWNGKLSVTVASNNITVALKTLAGNNPSSTDPVYVRIQDTIRTITTTLSVTKNAGTNWFNSGSSELATQEIDYFVYLGYNATDGVVIGFARIPYANRYNDFSTTSTNEKYAAISTITNAASTDYYELVGRFAATLSATASFNWSVPTFTANNLINRPIYETNWLAWVPTQTGWGGSPPTGGIYRYQIRMKDLTWQIIQPNSATSTTTEVIFTIPFAAATIASVMWAAYVARGINNGTTLSTTYGDIASAGTTIGFYVDFGGTAWTASGNKRIVNADGRYQIST